MDECVGLWKVLDFEGIVEECVSDVVVCCYDSC